MSIFGLIVSGRMVQTDFGQVDTNKFLITIPNAESINHVVVFLTGASPLPANMGASVYFSWPDPNIPPTWQYLGLISNEKPSAIFRITKLKQSGILNTLNPASTFMYTQPIVSQFAQIGISVEPLTQLQQLTPDAGASPITINSVLYFTTKTAENLFNFVSSFAQTIVPASNEQFVPLTVIHQWYHTYIKKLENNPSFWKE